MREILFRGFQMFKENDGWVYGYLKIGDIAGTRTAFIIPADFDKCPIKEAPVYEHTVSQYTGLKDKNGVKIFEGDIVRYTFDNPKETITTENGLKIRYGRIFWSDWRGAWAVTVGNSAKMNNDVYKYVRNGNRVQVIGNIYDNPELLEGDADGDQV